MPKNISMEIDYSKIRGGDKDQNGQPKRGLGASGLDGMNCIKKHRLYRAQASSGGQTSENPLTDWDCPQCSNHNYGKRVLCNKACCGYPRLNWVCVATKTHDDDSDAGILGSKRKQALGQGLNPDGSLSNPNEGGERFTCGNLNEKGKFLCTACGNPHPESCVKHLEALKNGSSLAGVDNQTFSRYMRREAKAAGIGVELETVGSNYMPSGPNSDRNVSNLPGKSDGGINSDNSINGCVDGFFNSNVFSMLSQTQSNCNSGPGGIVSNGLSNGVDYSKLSNNMSMVNSNVCGVNASGSKSTKSKSSNAGMSYVSSESDNDPNETLDMNEFDTDDGELKTLFQSEHFEGPDM